MFEAFGFGPGYGVRVWKKNTVLTGFSEKSVKPVAILAVVLNFGIQIKTWHDTGSTNPGLTLTDKAVRIATMVYHVCSLSRPNISLY